MAYNLICSNDIVLYLNILANPSLNNLPSNTLAVSNGKYLVPASHIDNLARSLDVPKKTIEVIINAASKNNVVGRITYWLISSYAKLIRVENSVVT